MDALERRRLINNLNRIGKESIEFCDYDGAVYEMSRYGIRDVVIDTFKFYGKSNLFKAGHNFFYYKGSDGHMEKKKIIEIGYRDNDGKVVEKRIIQINIICQLKKV